MRYLSIPESILIHDPITDEPTSEHFTFAAYVRLLMLNPHAFRMAEVLTLMDLRLRLAKAEAGATIALDDAAWDALATLARNPTGITPGAMYQAAAFLRAILDAPTKEPQAEPTIFDCRVVDIPPS